MGDQEFGGGLAGVQAVGLGAEGGAQQAIAALIPARRMATGSDVADVCLLLASPLAGYVSGADLRVDGGGEVPARYLADPGAALPRPASEPAG